MKLVMLFFSTTIHIHIHDFVQSCCKILFYAKTFSHVTVVNQYWICMEYHKTL